MGTGTTIQVFLPDGNPRSLKIAEITSRTVQAILIPRAAVCARCKDGRWEREGVLEYKWQGDTIKLKNTR